MARPGFKRWWTKFVPEPAERSTYVLLSSLALIAMFAFWRPLGGEIWSVGGSAARRAPWPVRVGLGAGAGLDLSIQQPRSTVRPALRQVWLNI
jgi:hypothetical protein